MLEEFDGLSEENRLEMMDSVRLQLESERVDAGDDQSLIAEIDAKLEGLPTLYGVE